MANEIPAGIVAIPEIKPVEPPATVAQTPEKQKIQYVREKEYKGEVPLHVEVTYVEQQAGQAATVNITTGEARIDPNKVTLEEFSLSEKSFRIKRKEKPVKPKSSTPESQPSNNQQQNVAAEITHTAGQETDNEPAQKEKRPRLFQNVAAVRSSALGPGDVTIGKRPDGSLVAVISQETSENYTVRVSNPKFEEGTTNVIGGSRIDVIANEKFPRIDKRRKETVDVKQRNAKVSFRGTDIDTIITANEGVIPELLPEPTSPPVEQHVNTAPLPLTPVVIDNERPQYPTMKERKAQNGTPPAGEAPSKTESLDEEETKKQEEKKKNRKGVLVPLLKGARNAITAVALSTLLIPSPNALPNTNVGNVPKHPDTGNTLIIPTSEYKTIDLSKNLLNPNIHGSEVWAVAQQSLAQVENPNQETNAQINTLKDVLISLNENTLVGADHEVPAGGSIEGSSPELAELVIGCDQYATETTPNTDPALQTICSEMQQLNEVPVGTNVTRPDTAIQQLTKNIKNLFSKVVHVKYTS